MSSEAYVLITAAKNEEAYIGRVLDAVVAQTVQPKLWVIVSDGSTDGTDAIVQSYADRYRFIRLLRLEGAKTRVFSSQAIATNAGYESIRNEDFEYVGFLDADISFDAAFYEKLLSRFDLNPLLGISGGQIVEKAGERYEPRYGNSESEVAGAVQFLRRDCYDEIGGLKPLRWGGHDAVANAMARRRGWQVRTFADLRALHHRPTGTVGVGTTRARFREGMQDYFMGYHLLFELGKCVKRMFEVPYVISSVLRMLGFLWPLIRMEKRSLPPDFIRYLKQQQLRRLFHGDASAR